MKEIYISKLVVNCCVGESGDRLTRAAQVLEELAGGQQPVFSQGTFLKPATSSHTPAIAVSLSHCCDVAVN